MSANAAPVSTDIRSPSTRLQEIRLAQVLSRKAFARLSGVSEATLYQIENLHHDPLYDTKRRIVKSLGLKVSDIWPEETDD